MLWKASEGEGLRPKARLKQQKMAVKLLPIYEEKLGCS